MNLRYQTGSRPEPTEDHPLSKAWQKDFLDDREPWKYDPDQGLVDAANAALMLRKPLLLTGEPGSGKTTFAYSVAWELGHDAPPLKFETKSTSVARDLFYDFNTLGMFQAAYNRASDDPPVQASDYITFKALGEAIIQAAPRTEHPYLKDLYNHQKGTPHVVLIDEIDKAPKDFPNDMLNEIERMYFKVPELGRKGSKVCTIEAPSDMKPVVVITSNSEKQLPDAFLRRCIYYHLPFPEDDTARLEKIVIRRLQGGADDSTAKAGLQGGELMKQSLNMFQALRKGNMEKKPSTGELIDWLGMMVATGAGKDTKPDPGLIRKTWFTLIKKENDRSQAESLLSPWLKPQKS